MTLAFDRDEAVNAKLIIIIIIIIFVIIF